MIKKIACIVMVVVVLFSFILVPRQKAYATGLEVNSFYLLYYTISQALGYSFSSQSDVALTENYNDFYDYYTEDYTRQLAIGEIAQDINDYMADGTLRYSGTWLRREAWKIFINAVAEFDKQLINQAQTVVGDLAYKITFDVLAEGGAALVSYSASQGMYSRKYYITYGYAENCFTLSSDYPFYIKNEYGTHWLTTSGESYRYQFSDEYATEPIAYLVTEANATQFALNSSRVVDYYAISEDVANVIGQGVVNPYTQIEADIQVGNNYLENIDDVEKDIPIVISVPDVSAISNEFERVDVQAGTSSIVNDLDITKSIPVDILKALVSFNFEDFNYTGGLPSIDNILPWHYVLELLGKGARGINFILRIYNEVPYDVRLCGYATIVVCLFGGLVIKMGGV